MGVACREGEAYGEGVVYHWAYLMAGAWVIIGLPLYERGLQWGHGLCLGVAYVGMAYGETVDCD